MGGRKAGNLIENLDSGGGLRIECGRGNDSREIGVVDPRGRERDSLACKGEHQHIIPVEANAGDVMVVAALPTRAAAGVTVSTTGLISTANGLETLPSGLTTVMSYLPETNRSSNVTASLSSVGLSYLTLVGAVRHLMVEVGRNPVPVMVIRK